MDDDTLIETGARNRYEEIRAMPGMREHWPAWSGASAAIQDTYRTVFAGWLTAVRIATDERRKDSR